MRTGLESRHTKYYSDLEQLHQKYISDTAKKFNFFSNLKIL